MRDYRQQAEAYLTSILKRMQRIRMQKNQALASSVLLKSINIVHCCFAIVRQREQLHKILLGPYPFITTVEWSLISLFTLKAHYSCAKELYGLTLHEYDTLSLLKYCFIQL